MRRSSPVKRLDLLLVFGILLLLLIFAYFNVPWAAANQQETTTGNAPFSLDAPAAEQKLYLPMIFSNYCVPGTVPCRSNDGR